jgi:hypothetical protein
MIPIGLAANTASALMQGLSGHQQRSPQPSVTQAAQQFGAQLDALMPGAGAAVGGMSQLGQDLLGALGLGAAPSTGAQQGAQPGAAAQAYVASGALR